MGFRNPITSATAVDTGAAAPGVKVYARSGNPASGVVEWDAYTASVKGTLISSQTGSGGSFFTLGMTGGPELDLNSEALPGGGYQNVFRLKAGAGGAIVPDVALTDLAAKTTIPPSAYSNSAFFAPGGFSGFEDAFYALDAAGYVHLGGLVRLITAGTWGLGATIFTLPAGFRPGKARLFGALSSQSSYAELGLQVSPSGAIQHVGNTPGWSYVANTWVALEGITFRAEQ